MEVAGLVLGIAGLYAVCTEIVDQFDSYRDFGVSSSQLAARFEADKLRLREWADIAGIHGGTLTEEHHRRLDDLAVRAIVYQILHSIVDLFPRTEQTLFDIRGKPVQPAGHDDRALHIGSTSLKISKKAKIKWAFGNEARFTRQVEAFELLTNKLYDLVPLDQGDPVTLVQPDLPGTSVRDIQLLSNVHEDLRILLEANKIKALAEDRRAVFEFLKVPQVSSEDFDNSLSKCLPGTCEWIFQLSAFEEWLLASTSIKNARLLWLNGTAGSGKSILCSRIISHLETLPHIHCFHFFCTTHVQAGGKLDDIIKVWLFEMVKKDQSCLEAMIETMFQVGTNVLSFHVWSVFGKLAKKLGNCIFAIDGLDEFNKTDDQRQIFIQNLKKILTWTDSKVLITSRDEVDIRRGIEAPEEGINVVLHRISQTDTQADVNLFSQEIVKQKLGTKDKDFQTELAATLASRSEGMFLWVALSGKYLRGGLSKARILQTVKNVPDGLLSAYARSWKSILDQPEYEKSRALDILGWCVCSIRPLTIAELTVALIMDVNHTSPIDMTDLPDEINDEYVSGEIIDLCGSLVEIRPSLEHELLAKHTVHIVHFSVKDFLSSAAAELNNESENHLDLAKKCLRYLCRKDNSTETVTASAFHEYAINHWHLHVTLSKLKDDSLNKLVTEFFTLHEDVFLEWASIFEKNLPSKSDTSLKPSPLYFAASLNLESLVQSLIATDNTDLNRKAGKLGTPLHATCYYGYIGISKLLLNSGADIDNLEGLYGAALHIAIGEYHPELVKVLIKHKALLNLKGNGGQTPLWIATANGRDDIVKLLIENHADISLPEVGGWTPLNVAAANGHLPIIEILLRAGAEMTPLPDGQTPLHLAAVKGHLKIIRMLIDHGATTLTSTTAGWTPLHSACHEQRPEVVKFLLSLSTAAINETTQVGYSPVNTVAGLGNLELVKILNDHGADLTIGTDTGFNPLHVASSAGHFSVVRFLLERNPSLIHLRTQTGCTPLYSAASGGHSDIVAFLLSNWPEMIDVTCDNWSPLNAAAKSGHQECVELLLDHHAAINISDAEGQTPLYSAASIGHLEIVRALLKRGADTTLTVNKGFNAAMTAAREGSLEVVKVLIEAGIDVSAVADDGTTALHIAALNGHPSIIQYLIDQGGKATASIDAKTTVLYNAVRHGSIEAVKMLLDNGADSSLSSTTDDGNTPLHLASSLGHSHLIEFLIDQGADVCAQNGIGMTSLNLAVLDNRLDVVKILLRKGADMQPNERKQTPLNNAAYNGYSEIVEILLDHGAEINVLNRMHWTPLHAACPNHITTIKLLLDRGADLTIPNVDGDFPIHTAANHDSPALVELLVNRGANIDQLNNAKATPLMFAARENRTKVVQYLFDQGANINLRNNNGLIALHIASQYGSTEVVTFLLKNGSPYDDIATNEHNATPLYYASLDGHIDTVSILLEAGADPNYSCNRGWTPIMAAADNNHIEVARMLIKHQANLNIVSTLGSSTVIRASLNGHLEMVQLLVNAGADYTLLDVEGTNALIFASSKGHLSIVEFLISRGADINYCNEHKYSPLLAACFNQHIEVIKLLLSHGAEINVIDDQNYTPLTVALTQKVPEVISILMDHGADVDILDDQNRTALHWAARIGSLDILQRISEASSWTVSGGRKDTDEEQAIVEANLSLQSRASDQLPVNQHCDSERRTPLHFAAVSGNVACAEYLVSKGYDLTTLDIRERSVLDYGCISGSTKMVAWLSERFQGKQISWSYSHWACRTGDFLLLKILYDMGYRSKIVKDEDLQVSWSPFDIARYYQNDKIILSSGKLSDELWYQIKDEYMVEASKVTPIFSNSLIAQGPKFRGYCDGCFCGLPGPRFHCLDCPDFDYCMMCKHDAHISHPGHGWKIIEPS